MTHNLILKSISKHINLDKEEENFFISLITARDVTKKTLIAKEGQVCRHISYVHSGALRAYYIDKEGKEATICLL